VCESVVAMAAGRLNQKQQQQWTTATAAAAAVPTTQWLVIEVNVVK